MSAIKVKGERAYHRVRAGESVDLPARPVTVSRFEIGDVRALEVDGTAVLDVDVEVTVSSGTYVRALARDLGAALGTGGHPTALRRTRVGGFTLDDAHPLADLEACQGERMPVTPLAQAARAAFAVREVDEAQARTIGRDSGCRRRCRVEKRWSRPSPRTADSWRCWTSPVPRHAASSCSRPRLRRVCACTVGPTRQETSEALRPCVEVLKR